MNKGLWTSILQWKLNVLIKEVGKYCSTTCWYNHFSSLSASPSIAESSKEIHFFFFWSVDGFSKTWWRTNTLQVLLLLSPAPNGRYFQSTTAPSVNPNVVSESFKQFVSRNHYQPDFQSKNKPIWYLALNLFNQDKGEHLINMW